MAQIRQEINILNQVISGTSTSFDGGNGGVGKIYLDTTQYHGTVTYYFEVLAKSTSAGADWAADVGGRCTITQADFSITTSYALYRKQFTPAAAELLAVSGGSNGSATLSIKSARIIIIQNATVITNTETQIEIGNTSNTTATTNTALTNPKYWKYDASRWNGTLTVYFESIFLSGTSKSAATMTLQTSTNILAPSWSDVASSAVTSLSTFTDRVRSGAITLVNGNWYRAVMKAGNSKSGITTYSARIIIDQAGVFHNQGSDGNFGNLNGSGGTLEALGQSFTTVGSVSPDTIFLRLQKVNSPTDNLYVEIVSTSITGTVLATSDDIAASSVSTTMGWVSFTFPIPASLSASTQYYLRLWRTGSRDTTNLVRWKNSTDSSYSLGARYSLDSGTWSSAHATNDFAFVITGITKCEPQYLLANTLFAAGTGLQTFLTKWDSTEWDAGSGSIDYYFQAEAADGSTSDVTLEQADGGGTVTNSTLTNIDNAQISSAMTMPGSENLDTKATTNAGDVAAARILVAYAFSAAAPAAFIADPPYLVTRQTNFRSNYY
jgi:hypothetical protein